ncbi:hypothetical protein BGZ83_006639 [Gryganskiella cystojenkinii]|nr:hypothetical protein BGZ83_006639 [Gryganskiella cystojenkinii]
MLTRFNKYRSPTPGTKAASISTPSSHGPPPMEINEILERIFSFLTQHTLMTVVSRVSRQWFYVAKRLFQHHLYLDHFYADSWQRHKNNSILPVLHERLSQADTLTVGKKLGPFWQIFGNINDKGWKAMSAALVKEIWFLNRLDERIQIDHSFKYINNALDNNQNPHNLGELCDAFLTDNSHKSPLKIKTLCLNLANQLWIFDQRRILTLFNPSTLQDLSMDLPHATGSVRLGTILLQCPNLLHLTISSLGWLLDSGGQWEHPWSDWAHPTIADELELDFTGTIAVNNSIHDTKTNSNSTSNDIKPLPLLPLRSLRLHSLAICPRALSSFLPALSRLTDLRLLNNWRASDQSGGFQESQVRDQFWRRVAAHCPQIETIRYSCFRDFACRLPLELFPNVCSWGIDHRSVKKSNPDWGILFTKTMTTIVENRLTSLEILIGDPALGYNPRSTEPDRKRDQLLYAFLCSSPNLIHRRTGSLVLSEDVLWGEAGYRRTTHEDLRPGSFWACRNLKTLSFRLEDVGHSFYRLEAAQRHGGRGGGDNDDSTISPPTKRVFGYLSRVCPRLIDLTVVLDCMVFALESGLCLLTRLKDLRRLAIYTDFHDPSKQEQAQKTDFSWIQGAATLEATTTITSNHHDRPWWKRGGGSSSNNHRDAILEDYNECLQAVRRLPKITVPFMRGSRSIVYQYQQTSNYETDHNGPVPRVDGLDGFQFCGDYIDMEALVQAQIFRFKQEQRRAQGLDFTSHQESKPWPFLERLTLSYARCVGANGKRIKRRGDQAQRLLRKMRPDIDIDCPTSDNSHLFLDL